VGTDTGDGILAARTTVNYPKVNCHGSIDCFPLYATDGEDDSDSICAVATIRDTAACQEYSMISNFCCNDPESGW
jgi:hypothetical protein